MLYNLILILLMVLMAKKVYSNFADCDFTRYQFGCDSDTNTRCDNTTKKCLCKQHYIRFLRNGICLKPINIDGECNESHECSHIHNAKCFTVDGIELDYNQFQDFGAKIWVSMRKAVLTDRNPQRLGICKCSQSYQYDSVAKECVFRVIGSACRHHEQCSSIVANSECLVGVCSCHTTHYHFNDSCVIKRGFNEFCSNDGECKPSLYCSEDSSQCKCRKNYELKAHTSECQYKFNIDLSQSNASDSDGKVWDNIVKVGGFVIIIVVMLFLCSKIDTNSSTSAKKTSIKRRRSTGASRYHHRRTSSVNSHRPLTQTSSNASRSSAYRTFEDPIRQILLPMPLPMPVKITRSTSSSSEDLEYNPYLFDTLFPKEQLSDNDDPPSYEDAIKEVDHH